MVFNCNLWIAFICKLSLVDWPANAGPLSPSKKSGDAKNSDPAPAEAAVADPFEEQEDSAEKPSLSSKKGKEALQSVVTATRTDAAAKKQASQSVEKSSSPKKGKDSSVTRSTSTKVAPSQKPTLSKGRDASRSATPVRMAVAKAKVARTPSPKEATSRSVTPKKLNFKPAERRVDSPGRSDCTFCMGRADGVMGDRYLSKPSSGQL